MTAAGSTAQFLVIDHHPESRFLLVKSLLRKFPDARIEEVDEGERAIELAGRTDLSAIITHRTQEYLGAELVTRLRSVNRRVPIVMVSGADRTSAALSAGADRFMLYDEWLRIGTIVQELLQATRNKRVVRSGARSGTSAATEPPQRA